MTRFEEVLKEMWARYKRGERMFTEEEIRRLEEAFNNERSD